MRISNLTREPFVYYINEEINLCNCIVTIVANMISTNNKNYL